MTKRKIPLPISIDEELAEWINKEAQNSEFRNRSHLVEEAIKDFLKNHKEEEHG